MFATIEGKVGSRRYLWCFHAAEGVVFVLATGRAHDVPEGYLGPDAAGIMVVDRYQAYQAIDQVKRGAIVLAFGWAHRKRDFQKVVDRGGPHQAVGRAGLKLVRGSSPRGCLPRRAGHADRPAKATGAGGSSPEPNLARRALLGEDPTVATVCENVLALEPALWTFTRVEGVEPTNNFVERLLRRAVLWRRRSIGSWSEARCRPARRTAPVRTSARGLSATRLFRGGN